MRSTPVKVQVIRREKDELDSNMYMVKRLSKNGTMYMEPGRDKNRVYFAFESDSDVYFWRNKYNMVIGYTDIAELLQWAKDYTEVHKCKRKIKRFLE